MTTNEPLRRELGFWAALTIGSGTMIGAGIFLLSGLAVSLTGPAAILSYVSAGIICLITAASAAELATGMPTSGGDYFFVSRSLGPAFGAISGIGIWLSLTFAIAFYLFGMGEYLAEFLPITPFWGAVAGGILFTMLNIVGAKESGGTQVVVVLTLIVILFGFIVSGLLHVDRGNLTPFMPYGANPIFTTTSVVFISFLGFVKIAAVSEEIKDPGRNLPRALIGSVALVTVLYVLIVIVVAGMFSPQEIQHIRSPLTVAARRMLGPVGAGVLVFGGLLATLSSANASIMAASRINLAMSRDGMVPTWLSRIHPKRLTPYRAILLTGGLALTFLLVESLETLAEIASVLQLYSYAALNVGVVVLRVAAPDWYRPSFRMPGTPYLQVVAALGCVVIVLSAGVVAQVIIVGLIILSQLWYWGWARRRVDVRYGLPLVKARWAQLGWRAFAVTAEPVMVAPAMVRPAVRLIDVIAPRRVMVALANPQHETDLLRLGRYLATGRQEGGEVMGLHLVRVPLQTPLQMARGQFGQRSLLEHTIVALAKQATAHDAQFQGTSGVLRPLSETQISAVSDVAHDVFGSLTAETVRLHADLLLLGWQGGFSLSRIYNSPVQRILANTPVDVAVLKNRGIEQVKSILIPWGGGPHAQLGLEFAVRIAEATAAEVHILRIVPPGTDREAEQTQLRRSVAPIVGSYEQVQYFVEPGADVVDSLQMHLNAAPYDLVIIGASHEWRIRNFLFGSIPDVVADSVQCSVLMVKRHLAE
ncbi:MAG: amino acid permease [Chloroflexi bacterium]|nr:amino acid permease [Chloroflexota bacterium]